jgi:RNA polymerase sigma-70 factor (ECF subfamily)
VVIREHSRVAPAGAVDCGNPVALVTADLGRQDGSPGDATVRREVLSVAMVQPTDAELLERWRTGHSTSGEALFERYYDSLERFFLNKVPNAVGDLVQETFTRCVASQARLRDEGHFGRYLIGIAKNVLNVHLREHYRRGVPIDLEQVTMCDLEPGPRTLVARRREHRLLLEALRNIPVGDQIVLELHYWEDFKTEDIADALEIPVGTAKGRLQRARERLEQAMSRLAESPNELESTMARLEDWAKECRADLDSYRNTDK